MLSPLAAAALAYVLTPVAVWLSVRLGAVDHPELRKIHRHPMPRLGGLAIIAAVVAVLGVGILSGAPAWALPSVLIRGLLIGLLPIVAVSLADDVRPVPARLKFLCHAVGATAAVLAGVCLPDTLHVLGYQLSISIFAIPLSVAWLIGVTNAFNIIDGLDGLAAGLALIAALTASAVFVTEAQFGSALLPLTLAGAIVGFMPYNLYPARVFLGDTGATAVGFALAAVALKGGATMSAGFAAATPILIMGLPIADTLVAIIRRLVRLAETRVGGIFQPDRNHLHHRLLAIGLNHRNAVLVLYGLGALTAGVAYLSLFLSSREAALMVLTLVIAGAMGLRRLGYDEFALVRRGTLLRFYEVPVLRRSMFVVVVDIAFVCMSCYLAVALQADDWLLRSDPRLALRMAVMLVPLSILVFWSVRLYEGSWRLATIDDYVRASGACGTVLFLSLVAGSWQLQLVPASVLVIYGLVSTFLIVGSRASYRVLVSAQRTPARSGVSVLIYGPDASEFIQARDLIDRAGSFGLKPVGFLTTTGAGRGQLLAGLQIFGAVGELPLLAQRAGVAGAVLARRRTSSAEVDTFKALCQTSNIIAYRMNTDLEPLDRGHGGESAATPADPAHLPNIDSGLVGWPTYGPSRERRLRDRRAREAISLVSG